MRIHSFFVTFFILFLHETAFGQLTQISTPGNTWQLYGQVKYVGPAKASLEYMVNGGDTTFLLLMYDMRPELKNYFSITFSGEDNTVGKLYEELMSLFNKEERKPNDIRMFRLGHERVSAYRSSTIGAQAIILSTDKGKIELGKGEIKRLFNKK